MLDRLQVEPLFNDFVVKHGGQLCSSLMEQPARFKNADYWFPGDTVIAELKCLEKDSFNEEADLSRWAQLIEKWERAGYINGSILTQYLMGTSPLPKPCALELQKLVRRSLEHTLRDARDQIRSTKQWLEKRNANGLVFLVNDGNFFFQHQSLILANEI